jgi:iron complex transport system ATP-binding protein
MIIAATDVTARYPGAGEAAVEAVSLGLSAGELVAVVGPNGSGKTTLVRALLGVVRLSRGHVVVLGRPLETWRGPELARVVGVVSQREETLFPLTVEQTVTLGRYAHLAPLASPSDRDRAVVEEALARADVIGLRSRRTDTLSGGEWQRVRVARALAQEPRLLVLDEPTASLDVRHEMEVLELVRRLSGQGIATLLVTHHLNLAARYADRVVLLHRGRVVADGPAASVLTGALVARVFDWPVAVIPWRDGSPQVVPLKPGE